LGCGGGEPVIYWGLEERDLIQESPCGKSVRNKPIGKGGSVEPKPLALSVLARADEKS